eukprot:TRINITY_DN3261_c0_g1_i1.p1 TRINITY_DN3261_c0_g1~~TRINITY_DN3261_c0_g1_i1.p1  ORF type:complete len:219 (-),score=51.44 TRINITY_DN3261_c0_g1_i1:354-1010(-)
MAGNPGSAPPMKTAGEEAAPRERLDPAKAKEMICQSWRQTFPKGSLPDILAARSEGSSREELFARNDRAGKYVCHRCALELYDSSAKLTPPHDDNERKIFPEFESSLVDMRTKGDCSFGLRTTVLRCPGCGLFVGDLFEDKVHGERHCLFSLMLAFIDNESGEVTYGTDAAPEPEEGGLPWGYIGLGVALVLAGAGAAAYYFASLAPARGSKDSNDLS